MLTVAESPAASVDGGASSIVKSLLSAPSTRAVIPVTKPVLQFMSIKLRWAVVLTWTEPKSRVLGTTESRLPQSPVVADPPLLADPPPVPPEDVV